MAQPVHSRLRSLLSRVARVKLRFAALALLVAVALISSRAWAQRVTQSPVPPNFDVRTEKTADSAAYLGRFAPPSSLAGSAGARAEAFANLERSVDRLYSVTNPETGVLEVVGPNQAAVS